MKTVTELPSMIVDAIQSILMVEVICLIIHGAITVPAKQKQLFQFRPHFAIFPQI